MKDFPLITAHTGCMDTLENTLFSIETGLDYGADIIEDDILVTRDGILVLSHDDKVRFADGTEGLISSMTLSELNDRLSTPISTLGPALDLIVNAGKVMNLDLKSDDCIGPVSELIERLGLLDRVFLSGCEYGRAQKAMQYNPRLNKLLNTNVRMFTSLSYIDAIQNTCKDARSAGCSGINIPYRLVEPMLLELASDYGLPVYIWTVNDERQMRHFAEMGVSSITTRDVAALVNVKREVAGYEL